MELIPILSTIILVATISTFILAVGAYILYKIREGKTENRQVKEPGKLQAEYVVPSERQIKKVYIEDVPEPKTQKIRIEEKLKPVTPKVEIYENRVDQKNKVKENFKQQEAIAPEMELPEEKYSKINSLHFEIAENQTKSGEIKWR